MATLRGSQEDLRRRVQTAMVRRMKIHIRRPARDGGGVDPAGLPRPPGRLRPAARPPPRPPPPRSLPKVPAAGRPRWASSSARGPPGAGASWRAPPSPRRPRAHRPPRSPPRPPGAPRRPRRGTPGSRHRSPRGPRLPPTARPGPRPEPVGPALGRPDGGASQGYLRSPPPAPPRRVRRPRSPQPPRLRRSWIRAPFLPFEARRGAGDGGRTGTATAAERWWLGTVHGDHRNLPGSPRRRSTHGYALLRRAGPAERRVAPAAGRAPPLLAGDPAAPVGASRRAHLPRA